MRRFWFWFRITALTACAVVLGVYLFHSTPWRGWLGMRADYASEIREGDPIVVAIYRFKAERGLWPEYMEDVAPAYLDRAPRRGWFYEVSPAADGRMVPALSCDVGKEGIAHQHLGFDFDPAQAGGGSWHVFSETQDRVVRRGAPAGANERDVRGELKGERAQRALAELDRRMAREPLIMEHWQHKAGLLVAMGRDAEARGVVAEACGKFPDAALPRVAEVVLSGNAKLAAPDTKQGVEAAILEAHGMEMGEFVEWVREQPSMTRWYWVSWLYRRGGEDEKAAGAMREAMGETVEVDKEDRHVAAYYLWDMGRWSLAQQRWALVIALADVWEKAEREGRVKEKSYLALRGAARLAIGDVAGARLDTERAVAERGIWAKNVAGLRAAAERADHGFRYAPGAAPGGSEIFEVPE